MTEAGLRDWVQVATTADLQNKGHKIVRVGQKQIVI